MPILVPFPTPAPTGYRAGTMPALALSRGSQRLDLSEANGWVILPGVEGLDDPPRNLIAVEPALWDGSLPLGARYAARDVFLPLHYAADSTESLRAVQRQVAALLDPKRGPVTLEVAHADGARRWIDGHAAAPYGKDLGEAEGQLWRRVGVTLRCGDPFFSGEQQQRTFQLGGTAPQFLSNTFLPVQLSESQITGAVVIDNPGDADAYPVWTLTGPCDSATIALDGTSWTVNNLLASETLVVDARRGVQTVTVNGATAWGRLTPGAQLGALPPGDNDVAVVVVGATDATVLTVAWRERWLTAW